MFMVKRPGGDVVLYVSGLHVPVKITGSGGRGSANHEREKLIDQDRDRLF